MRAFPGKSGAWVSRKLKSSLHRASNFAVFLYEHYRIYAEPPAELGKHSHSEDFRMDVDTCS